jgi:hypothetical protein
VSAQAREPQTDAEVRALFERRARAELASADACLPGADAVAYRGALLAEVAVVKGLPGPAEAAGGAALSGADGEAAVKALEALGWRSDELFFTLSRPVGGDAESYAKRLRLQIEAVDPRIVVALDAQAAEDLGRALDVDAPTPGRPAVAMGRRLVAVTAFEASLGSERLKRVAWTEMKLAAPPGPVF